MLHALRVHQFGIIEDATLSLGPGLTVLSGETGAGKSLLVDALGLVLGGRARAGWVRGGAPEAVVEALFAPPTDAGRERLREALLARGLPEDDELLVRRVLPAAGRGRVYLNGNLGTVGLLRELVSPWVELCGQHEHTGLVTSTGQRALLDLYATTTDAGFAARLSGYRAAFAALDEATRRLDGLDLDQAARAEREAFLRFQLREIETVEPVPGELEGLRAERERLRHLDMLREAVAFAEAALYSDEGAVVERLGGAERELARAVRVDAGLGSAAASLAEARTLVDEAARALQAYGSRLDADPVRLDAVEERLEDLAGLCRKHGGDLDRVLSAAESMRAELDGLTRFDDRLGEIRAQVDAARDAVEERARALSESRRQAAGSLARAVRVRLGRLGMAGTRFEVGVDPADAPGPVGADRVELRMAPGPDDPLGPVGRLASGGELSRLLLALRREVAARDGVTTVVFDEVDAGVGGGAAAAVGRALAEVAATRQVLCVTHLPQVAACADHHLVVRRRVVARRARAEVAVVDGDSRVDEIARMLAGAKVTGRGREHAVELLALGGRSRKAA